MLKVLIPESEIEQFTKLLAETLRAPYYAHLYHEDADIDTLIALFHGKIFYTSKKDPKDAIEYGIAHGVTNEQMDITPRNIAEEQW